MVLWICSGPLLLLVVALFQVLIRFAFGGADGGVLVSVVNIASWLTGLLGIILLFAGPIIGIVLLTKKQN